jgi:hypothetical protein
MTDLTKIETPQAISTVSPMVAMIERLVLDPNVPMDKLERMLAMQERIVAESAKAAFAAAFAAASAQFPSIPLNGKGDKNKPYALLKDIMGMTRPVLSRHGLALSFSVNSEGAAVRVTAELMHVDGHTKTTSIELPKDQSGSKNAVQAVGSSQTYGQRYTAQAILGLSLGDDTEDDGRAAGASATISADEFFELRNLIDEAGADEAKFCGYLKVKDLELLPKAMFAQAVSALRSKIKAKKVM